MEQDQENIPLYRIHIHGNQEVGKTQLLARYYYGQISNVPVRYGADDRYLTKRIFLGGTYVDLQIWDQVSSKNKYDASAYLLAVDLTKQNPLDGIDEELQKIREQDPAAIIYFVVTKSDLEHEWQGRIRTYDEIQDFAGEQKFTGAAITSATTGQGIDDLFEEVAEKVAKSYTCDFTNTKRKKEELIRKLNAYISRIESSQNKYGTTDYAFGFWFCSRSRAINREANYLTAIKLVQDLTRNSISDTFKNVDTLRDIDVIGKHQLHARPDFIDWGGINSEELNSIIDEARKTIAENPYEALPSDGCCACIYL